MYQLSKNKVLYNGRATKADPETFEELIYDFARDKSSVYYKGVTQKGPRPVSFRVLDEHYARDIDHVYFYSERKVKTIAAESASFQSLGFGFGRDKNSAFWLDKKMRADAATLSPLGEGVAADSKAVYWKNKKVHGRPLSTTGLRADVRHYRLYFWNREEVWFSQHGWNAVHMEADPATFQVLPAGYARDSHRLFYDDKKVADLILGELQPITPDWELVAVDDLTLFRRSVLAGCDRETLVLVDYYPVDRRGVFQMSGERLCLFGDAASVDVQRVLDNVVLRQWQLLEFCHPLGERFPVEDRKPERVDGLSVQARPGELELTFDGKSERGRYDEIPALVSRLWSQSRYGESFHRFLHSTGYLYPRGDWQVKETLTAGGPDFIALVKKMSPPALEVLARQVITSIYGDHREPYLQHLDYDSLAQCADTGPEASATTNLARAKELLANGEFLSERPIIRYRAAQSLYGLVEATSKTGKMLEVLAPTLLRLLEEESVTDIRAQWMAAADLFAARIFLHADRGEAMLYEQIEPFLEVLVENRFNLDLNLARLWEVRRYFDKKCDNVLEQLTGLVGPRPLSSLWSGANPDYPDLASWIRAADERKSKN